MILKIQSFFYYADALMNASDLGVPGPRSDTGLTKNVLNTVYFWAGFIAVGMIVYGAYLYVLSNGDSGSVKRGKDTILYAVIGLVIVILAYVITNTVITGVS